MGPVRVFMALCLALVFTADAEAAGREWAPEIFYVYPPGGRQGTTAEVEILGGALMGATRVHVSGGGVQTAIVSMYQGMNAGNRERTEKLTKLNELLAKTQKQNPGDSNALAEIKTQMALVLGKKYAPDDGKGLLTVQVTLAPDAEVGERVLRVETPGGLSNPYPFHVGKVPEFRKTEVFPGGLGKAYSKQKRSRDLPLPPPPTFVLPPGSPLLLFDEDMLFRGPPPVFTLPATVNGQIFPGQADRYRFPARKRQQLVIAAVAREFKPYLADGSPGWFVAVLTLYDAKGNEVACAQSYRFHPDPVILYKVPADGEYVLEVKDSVYRGRYDFVYRITVGEQPFITNMFPLGGRAGTQTSVKLDGWNLPATTLTRDAKGKGPGIEYISVSNKDGVSNRRAFAVDALPEIVEQETNDTPATAQKVTLPVIVNGRIDPPGDWDVFGFEGKAGEEIVAEVHARRLDSPLDSVLILTDAAGKRLAFNDDYEEKIGGAKEGYTDKGIGREPHHADSYIRAALPADGTYYLRLGDIQGKGGPEYAYRLHVRPACPDFAALVTKTSIGLRPGATMPLTVKVLRREGFAGAVDVGLRDAPPGFKLGNPYLSPKNPDQIQFVLTAPPTPSGKPVSLVLEARATIQGREVVHSVLPVDEMEQAFGGYYHAVPAKELQAVVTEPVKPVPPRPTTAKANPSKAATSTSASAAPSTGPSTQLPDVTAKIVNKVPILIPVEGTVKVQVALSTAAPPGKTLRLNDPPSGITLKDVSESADGKEMSFLVHSDPAQGSRPSQKGTLAMDILLPGKLPQRPRKLLCALPAIPFEVVVPSPAKE